MKAAIHERYGPPSSLRMVKVRCSTVKSHRRRVSAREAFITRLFRELVRPRNPSLGCELAGDVVAVGNAVALFAIGDRVFGFNDARWRGHAELKVIGRDAAVATTPDNVSYAHAAASTEGAHHALVDIRAAKVAPGHRVVVHGATGAIGSAAVQLLKHAGAHVVATSTTRNVALVASLGADRVIDHEHSDFTKCGERCDLVFDAVGKSSFGACKPLLGPRGIYVSTDLGPLAQNPLFGLVGPVFKMVGARRILFPIPTYTKADVEFLKQRLARGELVPVIDRTYLLDDIVAAFEYVETGQKDRKRRDPRRVAPPL